MSHEKFMREALKAARVAGGRGDYLIGAVIVKDGRVIARGLETLKSSSDPVNGHAEIAAIRKATKKTMQRYLGGCTLYSSHEPCPMCAAAAFWAKIEKIVFSVSREDMIRQMESNASSKFSWRQIDISCQEVVSRGTGHQVEVVSGVLREEGLELFQFTE